MEIKLLITGWFLGIIATLGATWLQAYLARKQGQGQTLMETRLSIYAKLLSTAKSEERYPPDARAGITPEEVDIYNTKVREWRKGRKELKGLATEALLLAGDSELQKKLSEFISSDDPDFRISNLENLMRKEIGIK